MTTFADFRETPFRSSSPIVGSRLGSTLSVDGEVDVSSIDEFRAVLRQAVGVSVVDLSGVSFFGVVGVGALVELRQHFTGRIVASTAVDRVVRTLGLDLA